MINHKIIIILFFSSICSAQQNTNLIEKPNILFIFIDDLNDWPSFLTENGVDMPHMKRLAESGINFTRAYTPSPICNPARVAIMTGVRQTRSGIYHNKQIMPEADHWIANSRTLPEHFRDQGYIAAGYGKIYHHLQQQYYQDDWTPGYVQSWSKEKEDRLPGNAEERWDLPVFPRHFGMMPDDWDRNDPEKMQQDTENANSAIQFLHASHKQPFFLALGIYRPHSRHYSARRYWERFPLESIRKAEGYLTDDLNDIPTYGRMLALSSKFNMVPPYGEEALMDFTEIARWFLKNKGSGGHGPSAQTYLIENEFYRTAVRAYLAAMAYADDLVGRVLDALENSDYSDNTIVVLTSDHGYHLGEKEHWHKFTLWERALRVPFLIRGPGLPDGKKVNSPVSLIDIYPTLVNLTGIDFPGHPIDGIDLTPLLTGITENRGQPVLSTYYPGYHSIRDERFRYIRYPDGQDELYDMENDPWEWNNLAGEKNYDSIRTVMKRFLPENEEEMLFD